MCDRKKAKANACTNWKTNWWYSEDVLESTGIHAASASSILRYVVWCWKIFKWIFSHDNVLLRKHRISSRGFTSPKQTSWSWRRQDNNRLAGSPWGRRQLVVLCVCKLIGMHRLHKYNARRRTKGWNLSKHPRSKNIRPCFWMVGQNPLRPLLWKTQGVVLGKQQVASNSMCKDRLQMHYWRVGTSAGGNNVWRKGRAWPKGVRERDAKTDTADGSGSVLFVWLLIRLSLWLQHC